MRSPDAPSSRTRSSRRCALRMDGTSGFATRNIRSAPYSAATVQELIWLPASTTRYSYCRVSSRKSSSIAPLSAAPGTIEVIRSGKNLEPGLVLDDELLQELAIEPVQVVDGVEHAVAGPDTQEERDLAKARLEIEDDRAPCRSAAPARRRCSPPPSSCLRRPWRQRTRASSPRRLAPCVTSRRAAVRRMAPWNVSSAGGQTKNSFAPARIAWRIRSGSALSATAKMLDAGAAARRRSMPAIADDASPRMSTMRSSGMWSRAARRLSMTLTGTGPSGATARPFA